MPPLGTDGRGLKSSITHWGDDLEVTASLEANEESDSGKEPSPIPGTRALHTESPPSSSCLLAEDVPWVDITMRPVVQERQKGLAVQPGQRPPRA